MYIQLILTASLAIWPSQIFGGVILRDAEGYDICESEDCLNTANHILKWLNPDIDPCEDFYEFACGNWRNLPIDERVNQSLGARDSLVEQFIPVLLKDASATNGKKHFENLRNFMITCMDNETIESAGVTPIKQLIKKAGGWPVLDADWSEEDWDFLNAEITLGGVLIDVGTTHYVADNSSILTFLMFLAPSELVDKYIPDYDNLIEGLKNEATKAYYDSMVDVAVELGADKEVAEKAMKEALEFEIAFIEELKHTNYSDVKKTLTLKEFQEAVPFIDFTKLLEAYLPESYTLLPEENIFTKKEFFLVLEKFLNQYPQQTFVNYMISKAVFPLLKYVTGDINMSLVEDGAVVNEKSRFDFCTEIVKSGSLGPALAAYLGFSYTDSSKVAADMTKVIIEELAKEVEESDWLDEITRQEAAKNISEIKIDVGFPQKIMDLGELDKLYEGYEIDTSKFLEAILYDKKWMKQRDFDRLHKNITSQEELIYMGLNYYMMKGLYASAHFIPKDNSIDVSGPMLNLVPLFRAGNPAYVNYGHVGTIVAHELIHAVDLNAAPAEEEEYLLEMDKWGSNKTENIYIQKKQCFIDFYSSINDTKTTKLKLNGTYTQREDMADNGGIKLSLRAYRKFADQLGSPERKLPWLQQYTVEQLFMISAANALCEIPYKKRRTMQLKYDTHSPFEFRVNGMMMNSPDFSEIFNCDKQDPMNPPDKCEVW